VDDARTIVPENRQRRLLLRAGLAIALACAAGLAFWWGHGLLVGGKTTSFLRWQDARVVQAGEALYHAHCSSCHGVPGHLPPPTLDGETAPPHDESGHTWQHPDFALFQLIRDGVAVANCAPVDPQKMPMFKDVLSDSELVAVLSYIKSRWPREIRGEHDKVNMIYGPYNSAVEALIDVDGDG
jgi:mono/diheme cytochrome c family protein